MHEQFQNTIGYRVFSCICYEFLVFSNWSIWFL